MYRGLLLVVLRLLDLAGRGEVVVFFAQHVVDIVTVPRDVARRLQQALPGMFAAKVPLAIHLKGNSCREAQGSIVSHKKRRRGRKKMLLLPRKPFLLDSLLNPRAPASPSLTFSNTYLAIVKTLVLLANLNANVRAWAQVAWPNVQHHANHVATEDARVQPKGIQHRPKRRVRVASVMRLAGGRATQGRPCGRRLQSGSAGELHGTALPACDARGIPAARAACGS